MIKSACLSVLLAGLLIVGPALANDRYLLRSSSQPGNTQEPYRSAAGYNNPYQGMRGMDVTGRSSSSPTRVISDPKHGARDDRNAEQERQRQEYEKQKKEIEEYNAKVRQHNAEVAEYNARIQAEAQQQRQQSLSSQSAHGTGDSNAKPYLWDEHRGNLPDWMKPPVERGWDKESANKPR